MNLNVDDSKTAQIFTSLCTYYTVLFTYLSSPPTCKLTEDKDISTRVALKVWFWDQQHQHQHSLENSWKCTFSGPIPELMPSTLL